MGRNSMPINERCGRTGKREFIALCPLQEQRHNPRQGASQKGQSSARVALLRCPILHTNAATELQIIW